MKEEFNEWIKKKIEELPSDQQELIEKGLKGKLAPKSSEKQEYDELMERLTDDFNKWLEYSNVIANNGGVITYYGDGNFDEAGRGDPDIVYEPVSASTEEQYDKIEEQEAVIGALKEVKLTQEELDLLTKSFGLFGKIPEDLTDEQRSEVDKILEKLKKSKEFKKVFDEFYGNGEH